MSRNVSMLFIVGVLIHTFVWGDGFAGAKLEDESAGIENLTVERIYGTQPLLVPLPTQIRWIGNNKGVSYLEELGEEEKSQKAFIIRSVPKGDRRVVCLPDTVVIPEDLRKSEDAKFEIGSYSWDKKGERVVFAFGGDLFTMEGKSGAINRRTQTEGKEQNPDFSPDGKKLAYTRDNDIYVLQLETDEEIRLTESGCDSVLNGILDWVYMEELYTRGQKRSFYWSPDSERLAFLQMREGSVPQFPLVDWIDRDPEPKMQRYPQPGDPNPLVRVGIVGSDGGEVVWADTDTRDDSYIARLYWLGDSKAVAIEKLNRAQDKLTLLFAEVRYGSVSVVLEETDKTWVNLNYLKHYYEEKRQFVWGSEKNGHQHLYLYNMDGSLIRQITDGNWEVTSLDGVNESKDRLYFTANKSDVMERQLFEVSEKGGEMRQITSEEGYHRVTMSPDNQYFIDRFSTEKRPTVVSVHDVEGKKLFEIADQMSPELAAMERPEPEFIKFKSGAGIEYYCSITKPAGFNRLEKYPVIVYVYGGPHAQLVSRGWSSSSLWHSMMAAKGYIIFTLDNRGSYGRGKQWEDHIFKNLGHHELQDQLAGVEYLRSLPYVDADRIGIWGWSYGGYMTLMALFKAPDVFEAGTAVAPVTDWRLYDSIYTERYMKSPEDNEEGYEAASPINFVDDFEGQLLVMHGDADDNVHAQNSFQLLKKMIDEGKQVDFMVYPQKAHGISGEEARVFLFSKMTEFFDRHLLRTVE